MFYIHSKDTCPWCVKAKELLTHYRKDYQTISYATKEEIAAFKAKGFRTFPQIYDGEKHIGGYEALVEYLDQDDNF